MKGQRIGYVRVSSFDQNPERQLEQSQVDKVFTDKASGKDTQRPELDALLTFVREGDTVVVDSMDVWRATSMTCAVWCKSSPSAACALSSSRNA